MSLRLRRWRVRGDDKACCYLAVCGLHLPGRVAAADMAFACSVEGLGEWLFCS